MQTTWAHLGGNGSQICTPQSDFQYNSADPQIPRPSLRFRCALLRPEASPPLEAVHQRRS